MRQPQTIGAERDASTAMTRAVLRRSWNYTPTSGLRVPNRAMGPYRVARNAGDPLSRREVCGWPYQGGPQSAPGQHALGSRMGVNRTTCTGASAQSAQSARVEPATCNVKDIAASSQYTQFRREMAQLAGYYAR